MKAPQALAGGIKKPGRITSGGGIQSAPGEVLLPEGRNGRGKWDAKKLIDYHDRLLSKLAWPENKSGYKEAAGKMEQLLSGIREITSRDQKLEARLSGSGLPGTTITGSFSLAITEWLLKEFGAAVELHSSEASPETVKNFFRPLLPRVEYESVMTGHLHLQQRINKLKGKNDVPALPWLVDLLHASALSYHTKEFLFSELKIYTSWQLLHPDFSRGSLGLPAGRIHSFKKNKKAAGYKKIMHCPLPAAVNLSNEEQRKWVDMARAMLVFLYRETDPFSFARAETVKLFELEKGITIALYSMDPAHRLSLESYIGYLVTRNGKPLAYGGGWIFGERCQFGINIPAPFRGGDSGFIFSQLLRTYRQYFGVKLFIIKPYQFGHNNPEAIASGAFWFYYKQGFRPEDSAGQKRAAAEWKKKKADPAYRSPVQVLKKLTGSPLALWLSQDAVPGFDASRVSLAVTKYIQYAFHGDREKAFRQAFHNNKKAGGLQIPGSRNPLLQKTVREWCLLSDACLSVSQWNRREKDQFRRIIRSKINPDEKDFIRGLQQHKRFWKDLSGHIEAD